MNVAASQGILGIVNLGGGHAGGGLERHLEAAARFPGRVLVFMELDERGCCDAAWVDREVARLVNGARPGGPRPPRPPAPWSAPAGRRCPSTRPRSTPSGSRWPGSPSPSPSTPGPDREDRERMVALVAAQPSIPFVALEMAGLGAEPGRARRPPRPATRTSTSTRRAPSRPWPGTPRRRASSSRPTPTACSSGPTSAWLQGPRPEQRALSIGDGPPVRSREPLLRFFDSTWRFFESREAAIPGPVAGDPTVEGLALPRAVLEKIFRDNARRLVGFGDLEAL